MSYAADYPIAAEAQANARAEFIRKTYAHVAGAVLAFVGIEYILMQLPIKEQLIELMVGRFSWLLVLGAFMAVSWVAERWAQSDMSRGMQYAGLGLFVFAEALLFLPLIYIALAVPAFSEAQLLAKAAILTLTLFAGLTAAVLLTRHDFSFLGTALTVGGFVALGFIVASAIFGFGLGLVFCFAMVAFASAAILYHTSNVLHHYRTDQYVAASLTLFASVALLFWYVLQILMRLQSRD